MNWKTFVQGAIHAAVSGAASSLGGFVADPSQFNLGTLAGAKKLGILALTGSIIGLIGFLRQSPLQTTTTTSLPLGTVVMPPPGEIK